MKRALRRAKSIVLLTDPFWRLAISRLYRRSAPRDADRIFHVLIAPPGAGNIGDQAMVEAFIATVQGPVVVVVRESKDVVIDSKQFPSARVVELPNLIYGNAQGFARDLRSLADLLTNARSLSVVGADIMDGAYNYRASCSRSLVAEYAARSGIDARVLGFSWNSSPNPTALRYLRRAGRAGVRLHLRDPESFARAKADRIPGVSKASDVVFSTPTATAIEPLPPIEGTDRPYVVVNASGLIQRKFDQLPELVPIVENLIDRGFQVVVLPHVARGGREDIDTCQSLFEAVDRAQCVLVDHLLAPREILSLAANAEMVITGRMHLSILAMLSGTPAVILATQGKVQGLLQMFNLDWCCVEPERGMSAPILGAVTRILNDPNLVRAHIMALLPGVRELSYKNFAGLVESNTGANL